VTRGYCGYASICALLEEKEKGKKKKKGKEADSKGVGR